MAHKTLISGTAYDVKGGRDLIDGTGYAQKQGKTPINGTAYEVSFGPKIYTITVTGGAQGVGDYVFYNRTVYTSGSFEIQPGESVLIHTNFDFYARVTKDGSEIEKGWGPLNYEYTPSGNEQITYDMVGTTVYVHITSEAS